MSINGYNINGAEALDEESYQLWLRDPAASIAHLVEIDYNGTSDTYPDWVTYTLKSSDTSGLSFIGYPDRVKSIGSFTRQIGTRFTGVVSASIGEVSFYNLDGSLDQWHNLSVDGQRVRILHGDPSWALERFRVVYECIAETFSTSTWDTVTLRLRGIDYKSNLPLQTNLISTTTSNSTSNLPIPKAYGNVFNVEPAVVDSVNLIYQWNDGAVTSVSNVRDGGVPFNTAQSIISSVVGNLITTSASHGFFANTRVRSDIGSLPTSSGWSAIVWIGDKFVASSLTLSQAATSIDGIKWDAVTLPISPTALDDIAWSGSVVCGVAGVSAIAATSPDGITWTQRTLPTSANWVAITWNGTVFCAVASGSAIAATSPDGITWTQRTLPVSTSWADITWNGTVFCAVASGSAIAATSPDGITWTQRTLPVSTLWTAITWNGTVFCAVAQGSAIAATSPDGITWTQRTLPTSTDWYDISWNGTVFCTVALDSSIAATSPDGITWTQRTLPASAFWEAITWNGTVFCALASAGQASVSADGATWTAVTGTLPSPLALATDYWVVPDGLTSTAFSLSATRGGSVITLTNTTSGGALIGYHWTANLTTGTITLDSKSAGQITLDGVAGNTDAAEIIVDALSASNVDSLSKSRFQTTCPQTMGIYVKTRRNRLEVADDVISGLGAWYGYGRNGMLRFGRVEGNPTSYDYAITADDIILNSLQVSSIIKPEKKHRLAYKYNWTSQAGALFASVSADNRDLFSNEYSASAAQTSVDVGSDGSSFHALAVIPDVQKTMMALSSDAVTEVIRLDAMYYGWGAVFSVDVLRVGVEFDIGDVIKVTHSRFGFTNGVNTTCVYVNDNPSTNIVNLKLFVALAVYTPGQL